MTTSNIPVTPGAGAIVATNSITEDTVTKQLQRVVLNDSAGAEVDFTSVTVDGTVTANLGTIAGVATEASLAKLTLGQGLPTLGQTGPLAQGAVTTASPTYTTAQTAPLSLDTTGALRVNVTAGGAGGGVAQGAVTTAAPTYTTATDADLSLDLKGGLRTLIQDDAGNPVDWTLPVEVDQGTSPWIVGGAGTAGSAAAQVVTVQGVASMTPVQVSQATAASLNATVTGSGSAASPAAGLLSIQGAVADDAAAGTTNPVAVGGVARTTLLAYSDGDRAQSTYNTQGGLLTGGPVAANAAAGLETAVFPAPIGGDYRTMNPTYVDGDRVVAQFTNRGLMQVAVGDANGTANTAQPLSDTISNTSRYLLVASASMGFDGNTWGRLRSMTGAASTGVGTLAVERAPSALAAAAIAPNATAAAGSNVILKGSGANVHGINVVSGASAGVVFLFNATSIPSNGAVTPVKAYILAANSSLDKTFDPPLRLGTGAVLAFGTGADPFSLTASATAFLSGEAL